MSTTHIEQNSNQIPHIMDSESNRENVIINERNPSSSNLNHITLPGLTNETELPRNEINQNRNQNSTRMNNV